MGFRSKLRIGFNNFCKTGSLLRIYLGSILKLGFGWVSFEVSLVYWFWFDTSVVWLTVSCFPGFVMQLFLFSLLISDTNPNKSIKTFPGLLANI